MKAVQTASKPSTCAVKVRRSPSFVPCTVPGISATGQHHPIFCGVSFISSECMWSSITRTACDAQKRHYRPTLHPKDQT